MVFSLPKNERYTLHSPDAIFIQREPDKYKIVERNDRVNSEYIKEFLSNNDDYFSDPITVYDKGVDPMRSFMYTNPTHKGFQTGSGKFSINDSFRPPMITQADLLPIFKKRNVDYISYDVLPEFKQFLQSISCNKDLQKILKVDEVTAKADITKMDPYKSSYVQSNKSQQVVKINPIEIHKETSKQMKTRSQHDSKIEKELVPNINANYQANIVKPTKTLTSDRGTNNFHIRQSVDANFANQKQYMKNIVKHDTVDEKRTVNVMDVSADNHKIHKQRDAVSYLGDVQKFQQERAPETTVQTSELSKQRNMIKNLEGYQTQYKAPETMFNANSTHSKFTKSISPNDVNVNGKIGYQQNTNIGGYMPIMNRGGDVSLRGKR